MAVIIPNGHDVGDTKQRKHHACRSLAAKDKRHQCYVEHVNAFDAGFGKADDKSAKRHKCPVENRRLK